LLRLLLTSPSVTFSGSFFSVDGASIGPLPGKPLDIWLGGSAAAGLRRVGRLADGWLGSLLTPDEAGAAVRVINEAADAAGREVEQDHFGLSIPVAFGPVPEALAASIARRRPGTAPEDLVADGWAGARRMIAAYAEAGLSKFVVRAAGGDPPLTELVAGFRAELMPLQN
jgi:probable F420-dependent oxidoreductase